MNAKLSAAQPGALQRQCDCGAASKHATCPACATRRLQRKAADGAARSHEAVPPIVQDVLNGPGAPLPPATRGFMEERFGHDFGRVRVHDDSRAAQSATAVAALAYTVGSDVVFGPGEFAPNSTAGQRLLAHELAHVVQQSQGTSGPAPAEAHEHEADAAAVAVASGDAIAVRGSAPVGIQRTPMSDEAISSLDKDRVLERLRQNEQEDQYLVIGREEHERLEHERRSLWTAFTRLKNEVPKPGPASPPELRPTKAAVGDQARAGSAGSGAPPEKSGAASAGPQLPDRPISNMESAAIDAKIDEIEAWLDQHHSISPETAMNGDLLLRLWREREERAKVSSAMPKQRALKDRMERAIRLDRIEGHVSEARQFTDARLEQDLSAKQNGGSPDARSSPTRADQFDHVSYDPFSHSYRFFYKRGDSYDEMYLTQDMLEQASRAASGSGEAVDVLNLRTGITFPSAINAQTMPRFLAWLEENKEANEGKDLFNFAGQQVAEMASPLPLKDWKDMSAEERTLFLLSLGHRYMGNARGFGRRGRPKLDDGADTEGLPPLPGGKGAFPLVEGLHLGSPANDHTSHPGDAKVYWLGGKRPAAANTDNANPVLVPHQQEWVQTGTGGWVPKDSQATIEFNPLPGPGGSSDRIVDMSQTGNPGGGPKIDVGAGPSQGGQAPVRQQGEGGSRPPAKAGSGAGMAAEFETQTATGATLTAVAKPDGTIEVRLESGAGGSRVGRSTTLRPGDAKQIDKIVKDLGVHPRDASSVLVGLRQVEAPPRTFISMAQDSNPEAFVRRGLTSTTWGSDAFARPPTKATRDAARDPGEGLKKTRLSRFGLVFQEGTLLPLKTDALGSPPRIDRFTPKTSETIAVTEWQHLNSQGKRSETPAIIVPIAAVEINDQGVIVRIVGNNFPGPPAEAHAKLIAVLKAQGWTVEIPTTQ